MSPPAPIIISAPPNPLLLLIDNDALSQLLISGSIGVLLSFKKRFKIQPAIVESVDSEVRQNKNFFQRVKGAYDKALGNSALLLLDDRSYPSLTPAAHAVSTAIAVLGHKYHIFIDEGEAYTHAAAVYLKVPVISNDIKALRIMDSKDLQYTSPVLRTFDLVALAYQAKLIDLDECERIRKALAAANEYVPACFRNTSFEKGLSSFFCRLRDGSASIIGKEKPESILDVPLVIQP